MHVPRRTQGQASLRLRHHPVRLPSALPAPPLARKRLIRLPQVHRLPALLLHARSVDLRHPGAERPLRARNYHRLRVRPARGRMGAVLHLRPELLRYFHRWEPAVLIGTSCKELTKRCGRCQTASRYPPQPAVRRGARATLAGSTRTARNAATTSHPTTTTVCPRFWAIPTTAP